MFHKSWNVSINTEETYQPLHDNRIFLALWTNLQANCRYRRRHLVT
jgi:hypothetical protein